MDAPVFYAMPTNAGDALTAAAAVASWDRKGSPGQARSAAFVADVAASVAAPLDGTRDPLAIRLDVALPAAVPLLHLNDLDNYLYPLVPALTRSTGRQFVSVWATKRHAAISSVAVATAQPVRDPDDTYAGRVHTTASATTVAYRQQIRDQISAARPRAEGAVALELAFVVGPRRAWPNLWKATIDSLGSILGRDAGAHEWNVRDGRITRLGLHCNTDPAAGDAVTIAIRAGNA